MARAPLVNKSLNGLAPEYWCSTFIDVKSDVKFFTEGLRGQLEVLWNCPPVKLRQKAETFATFKYS